MGDNSEAERNAVEPVKAAGNKRAIVSRVAGAVLIVVAGWGISLAHKRGVFSALQEKLQALPQSGA
jgi:hypothetical protein